MSNQLSDVKGVFMTLNKPCAHQWFVNTDMRETSYIQLSRNTNSCFEPRRLDLQQQDWGNTSQIARTNGPSAGQHPFAPGKTLVVFLKILGYMGVVSEHGWYLKFWPSSRKLMIDNQRLGSPSSFFSDKSRTSSAMILGSNYHAST